VLHLRDLAVPRGYVMALLGAAGLILLVCVWLTGIAMDIGPGAAI
jgi:hypothetical protein